MFELTLFKRVEFVHTSYFRIGTQEYLCDTLQVFIRVCWECIIILKENFPSKIIMYQNNLKLTIDFKISEFEQEIYRRELNQIKCKLYEVAHSGLMEDEKDDLFQVMQDSVYYKDYKGLCVSLDLLLKNLTRLSLSPGNLKALNELANHLYFADAFNNYDSTEVVPQEND